MASDSSAEIQRVENCIEQLTNQLAEAKSAVTQWVDANKSLSLSAAQERAKNQGAGRGMLGGLLGAKFRSAMRAGAAASNAAIAKDVANKRTRIAEGKSNAQALVAKTQEELRVAKQQLKELTVGAKSKARTSGEKARSAIDSIDLLRKLKDAHDAGLLTEEEFEQKRKKLVSEL